MSAATAAPSQAVFCVFLRWTTEARLFRVLCEHFEWLRWGHFATDAIRAGVITSYAPRRSQRGGTTPSVSASRTPTKISELPANTGNVTFDSQITSQGGGVTLFYIPWSDGLEDRQAQPHVLPSCQAQLRCGATRVARRYLLLHIFSFSPFSGKLATFGLRLLARSESKLTDVALMEQGVSRETTLSLTRAR